MAGAAAGGAGELDWNAQVGSSVVRAHQHAAGPAKGARLNPGKSAAGAGAVTGWLTAKLHTVCDGRGRNLATRPTPGQDADTSQLVGLVDAVRAARPGGRGRPYQRPDHLTGDKAYSSPTYRAAPRARRIRHTVPDPERDDQKANRTRKTTRGGRRRS